MVFGIFAALGWMGRATEELAEHLGHGMGGLLNATFGNAAELIIALMALSKGLTGVGKASITGSIIGNVLLVMGVSILAGGIKFREQRFNKTAARTSTTTLTLAAVALATPTVFHVTAAERSGGWSQATEQNLSLAIAVVLFLTYACMLGLQSRTGAGTNGPSMKISKVQEAVSGLNRSSSRPRFFVAAFLLAVVGEATVAAVHGGEEDDIKALSQLENDIAQAWVQRDTQTLDRILAGDYTFAGAGDVLIDKEQWVAGVDYPGIRTTSAIVDDLRIRVYGDAAVVTGRGCLPGLV